MRGGRRRGGLIAVTAAALLGAALPAQSSAITFGANLSRTPDNTATCNSLSFGTYSTCSTNFSDITAAETGFPPVGRGVITRVRVRVGPVTGPMQVVVEQALRQDNPSDPGHPTYACCQAIRVSQVFTPAANAISSFNVNLPIRQDLAPDPNTGIYTDQHLALSVLAPNVPIPAASNPNGSYGIWFPAWAPGDERAGPYGGVGATVLLSADWKSCGKAKSVGAAKKKRKKSACGKRRKKGKKK